MQTFRTIQHTARNFTGKLQWHTWTRSTTAAAASIVAFSYLGALFNSMTGFLANVTHVSRWWFGCGIRIAVLCSFWTLFNKMTPHIADFTQVPRWWYFIGSCTAAPVATIAAVFFRRALSNEMTWHIAKFTNVTGRWCFNAIDVASQWAFRN